MIVGNVTTTNPCLGLDRDATAPWSAPVDWVETDMGLGRRRRRRHTGDMTTVFALSGGGNLGAVQVGMLRALAEAGIRPDAVVGTSVGALNGSWLAQHGPDADLDELASIWRGLKRAHVFPFNPRLGFAGFIGRRSHMIGNGQLRRLLAEHVHFERLEDSLLPFAVVAADVLTGEAVVLRSGPTLQAILASSAIPGVFEPVVIDGRTLVDGGIVDGTPICHAVDMGATEVWALPTGFSCGLDRAPGGALAMVLHSVAVLAGQQLARDIELFRSRVRLHVIPPPCPLDVLPHDFGKAELLMERAYEQTSAWIEAGCPEIRASFANRTDLSLLAPS